MRKASFAVSWWSRVPNAVVAYAALFVLLDVVVRLPGASAKAPWPVLLWSVLIEGWLVWGLARRSALAWTLGLSFAVLGVFAFVVDVPRDAEITAFLAVSLAQAGLLLTPPLLGLVWKRPA